MRAGQVAAGYQQQKKGKASIDWTEWPLRYLSFNLNNVIELFPNHQLP